MIEQQNPEKRLTSKNHMNKEDDVIGLKTVRANPEIQNFSLALPGIETTNFGPHLWPSSSALKTDRREVSCSIPRRAF